MSDEIKETIEPETIQTETEDEESYGMISKIIGVFIEPSKAFKHIAKKPEIWGPILTAFILMLIVSFFTFDKMLEITLAQSAEQTESMDLPDEQIELGEKIVVITTRLLPLLQVMQFAVIWLIIGGVAYFIGLFMGQDSSYKSSLAVVAYASLPAIVIKQVVISTIVLLVGNFSVGSEYAMAMAKSGLSLYSLFGNANMNEYLQSALMSFDVFIIWSLFLMAVGFKYANNVRMSYAWRTSIIVTLVVFVASIFLVASSLKTMAGA